jgi:uncharacterized protein (TIGR03000 family)
MSKRWVTLSTVAALAVATALLLASPGQAQRRGGRRGGGHYEGNGGYYGEHHEGWRGYGWGGYYLGSPYYGYGYYPYRRYYYSPDYYSSPDYYYSEPTYSAQPQYYSAPSSTGYYDSDVMTADNSPVDPNSARIMVRVRPDAQVWFDDEKTDRTGVMRQFISPPLTPGKTFAYDVKAAWIVDNQEVTNTRHVRLHAGESVLVDFTRRPPAPAEDSGRRATIRYGSQGPVQEIDRPRDSDRPGDVNRQQKQDQDLPATDRNNTPPATKARDRSKLPGTTPPPPPDVDAPPLPKNETAPVPK